MKPRYISLDSFVPWMDAKRPIYWEEEFGRKAELEVEIAFGLGDFLVSQAKKHPEKNFAGIELSWVLVQRALRKIALADVKNVRVMRANAQVCFERVFAEKSLRGIWALFPCPWPKKKHIKNRLFSGSFLKLLNSRLMDDCRVLLITDDPNYFDWIQSQLSGAGFHAYPEIIPPRFSTKYERKWQNLGQDHFYQLSLIKRQHIKIPLKEDIGLKTYRIEHLDPARLNLQRSRGSIIVQFKEILYDPLREKGMVRSIVKEDTFTQDFWIELCRQENGWHIRPAKGCGVIPTAGVQRALDLVHEAARG